MGKVLAWTTVGLIILGTCAVALFSIGKSGIRLLDIGTFVVISLTLIALVFYANDTNRLTRITQSKWERETILAATYGMACQKDKGHPEITAFILNNPSTLLIRAKVWAVCKVYGNKADPGAPYNGTDTWLLFPQQISQGWFSIEDLVAQHGKNIAQMQSESSIQNETTQLTLDLTIEFRDEHKNIRKLPTRRHYFSFKELTWIPVLTRKDDQLWEKG